MHHRELPTEEFEIMKEKALRSPWGRVLDSFSKTMSALRATLVALVVVGGTVGSAIYWGADRVFATDAEVKEIQEQLSSEIEDVQDEIVASENRIKCDALNRAFQELDIERKVLMRLGDELGRVDQEKFDSYLKEYDRECTPQR